MSSHTLSLDRVVGKADDIDILVFKKSLRLCE